MRLQTIDDSIDSICWDETRHNELSRFNREKTGLRLKGYKNQVSPFTSKMQIAIEANTIVQGRRLDFEFTSPKPVMVKIDHIIQNSPIESTVSFIGTVCKLSSTKVSPYQLRYKEAVVKDETAPIRVVFWEEALDLIEENSTYEFIEFRVKSGKNGKYVNTPKDTSLYKIKPTVAMDVTLCDDTIYLSIDKQATVTILSLMEYTSILRCPSCKLGAITPCQNPRRKGAGQCGRCPSYTSLSKCATEYSAQKFFLLLLMAISFSFLWPASKPCHFCHLCLEKEDLCLKRKELLTVISNSCH